MEKNKAEQKQIDKKIKKYVKHDLMRRLNLYCYKIIPQIIDAKSDQKFLTKMICTLPYAQSSNLMDIARLLETNENDVQTCECYLSRNINTIDPFLIQTLMCKDALNKLTNHEFYLIIDGSSIEKKYTYIDNKRKLSMQYIWKVWDNAQQKTVNGYQMITVIAVRKDTKETFILGNHVFSVIQKGFKSANDELKNLLNPIFKEFERQNKYPSSILCDAGFDDYKLFEYFTSNHMKFTLRYSNTRKFSLVSETKKYTDSKSYKPEDLYKQSNNKYIAEYYTSEGKLKKCIATYHKCFINKYKNLVYAVVYHDIGGKEYTTLITTNPVYNEETMQYCIYRYTSRWIIEELFRFMKKEFHIENFLVRQMNAIESLLLMIMIVINFMSKITCKPKKNKFRRCLLYTAKTKTKNKKYKLLLYKIAIAFKNLMVDDDLISFPKPLIS